MKTDLILCPVDYSFNSSVAFDLVSRLAKPGNKVVLLHVASEEQRAISMEDAWIQKKEAELRDQILAENSVKVEHLTQVGDPVEVIVKVASIMKVDLIVMGTHGRTGWSRLMLGSVAQGVSVAAPCNVVTVRPYNASPEG